MKWLIKTGERIYGSGACRIQQLLTTLFSAGGHVEKFSAAALSSPKEIQLLDNNSLNASDEDDVNQSSWLTWGVASWAFLINICAEKKVLRAEKKLNCYIKAWKDVKTLGFYSISSSTSRGPRQLWAEKGFFNYLVSRLSALNSTVLYGSEAFSISSSRNGAIMAIEGERFSVCVQPHGRSSTVVQKFARLENKRGESEHQQSTKLRMWMCLSCCFLLTGARGRNLLIKKLALTNQFHH